MKRLLRWQCRLIGIKGLRTFSVVKSPIDIKPTNMYIVLSFQGKIVTSKYITYLWNLKDNVCILELHLYLRMKEPYAFYWLDVNCWFHDTWSYYVPTYCVTLWRSTPYVNMIFIPDDAKYTSCNQMCKFYWKYWWIGKEYL